MKAPLFTQTGKQKGDVDLAKELFGAEVKPHLVHLALVRQHANARLSSAHTLRRGEVAGTTAKMFRQKGTGRARMGDRRSSILRGGGVAWGPRNTKTYDKRMNKKERTGAIISCLSDFAAKKKVFVLENFEIDLPKTKAFLEVKKALPENRGVLVIHDRNDALARSCRNVEYVKPVYVGLLNVHDLTKYDSILVEQSALEKLPEIYTVSQKKATSAAK